MTGVTSLGTVAFQEIFADRQDRDGEPAPGAQVAGHSQRVHSKFGGGAELYEATLALQLIPLSAQDYRCGRFSDVLS